MGGYSRLCHVVSTLFTYRNVQISVSRPNFSERLYEVPPPGSPKGWFLCFSHFTSALSVVQPDRRGNGLICPLPARPPVSGGSLCFKLASLEPRTGLKSLGDAVRQHRMIMPPHGVKAVEDAYQRGDFRDCSSSLPAWSRDALFGGRSGPGSLTDINSSSSCSSTRLCIFSTPLMRGCFILVRFDRRAKPSSRRFCRSGGGLQLLIRVHPHIPTGKMSFTRIRFGADQWYHPPMLG